MLTRVYGVFARLAAPVDFDSVDGQPVDLVFVLLAPEHAGADHLKALARISRLLRDPSVVEKLRGTDDPEGLYAILTEPAASPATNASAA
jgi:PTS system nitrogen regulatory IIA component